VTIEQRHIITGNCMDQAAVTGLFRSSLCSVMPLKELVKMRFKPVHDP
jgi:hypothetical protein